MKKFDLLASLSHVDEKMIADAQTSMNGKPQRSKTALWGRIGVVAVSLAVVVAIGAVSVPLLMSGDTVDTEAGNNILQESQEQTGTNDVVETPQYAPLLHIVPLSQASATDSEDENTETPDGMVGTFTQESFWRDSYAALSFDTSLGTNVTLTTFWDNLHAHDLTPALGRVIEDEIEAEGGKSTDKLIQKVLASFRRPTVGRGQHTVTVDVEEQYVVWGYDTETSAGNNRVIKNLLERMENAKAEYGEDSTQYLIFKERYESHYAERWGDAFGGLLLDFNEDMLIYTIRNDNGEIMAVGAIYTYHKHLIDNVDHIYYDDTVITRYADLGCIRFDTPVSEEEAVAQLVTLYENIPTAKESMDFTPKNPDENFMSGLADLLANYPFNPPAYDHYSTSGFSHSSADNFCTFHVGWVPKDQEVVDASHANHVFYIYDDGTWVEVTDEVMEEEKIPEETQDLAEIAQDTQ